MGNRMPEYPGRWSTPSSIFSALSALSAVSGLLAGCSDVGNEPIVPSTGSLEITTTTTGQASSGDGYFYILDGNPAQPIAFNTTIHLTDLSVGSHTITLTTLPEGCTTASPNPVTVGVTSDVLATAAFEVNCVPSGTGNIQVMASTLDPATPNYALLLDGEDNGTIAANGTQVLPEVAAGLHAVGVGGIPANCQLLEANPQPVTVLSDEVVSLAFTLNCTAPPAQTGVLSIDATTTGTDPDGFLASVDGGKAQPLGNQFALTIINVATGNHSIELQDLDGGCTVTGANPIDVMVSAGAVVRITFAVSCG
jgi:hypothetical protein